MIIDPLLPKHFEHFVIRNWNAEDTCQLANIEFDTEVRQYLPAPPISKELFIKNPFMPRGWAIAAKQGNIVAGTIDMCGTELAPKKKELRILLAKNYQGRGFAFEAARFLISNYFDIPWLEGVVAVVHPDNSASIALCKKLGFTHTSEITAERQVYELSRSQYLRHRDLLNTKGTGDELF